MAFAPNNANLIVGTGELSINLAYANSEGVWSPVGGFRDGVQMNFSTDRSNLQGFDQSIGTVRSVRTGIEVNVSVQLTEATLVNLQNALGIDNTFTSANTMVVGFSHIESPTAIRFVGEDDNGGLKTFIFSEAYPAGNVELSYQRDSETRIPMEWILIGNTVVGTPAAGVRSTIYGAAADTEVSTISF